MKFIAQHNVAILGRIVRSIRRFSSADNGLASAPQQRGRGGAAEFSGVYALLVGFSRH